MSCGTSLMSLLNDLNHEWQPHQQIKGEKDRKKRACKIENLISY